jgi:fatty-acyl-CoA synthase
VPIPDERMGEIGAVFVVLREHPPVSDQDLIDYCAQRLARFKVPRHVLRIAAQDIPATPSGRARKFLLVQIALKALGH